MSYAKCGIIAYVCVGGVVATFKFDESIGYARSKPETVNFIRTLAGDCCVSEPLPLGAPPVSNDMGATSVCGCMGALTICAD